MFVDEAKIYVKAGGGGNGCNSFYRDKWNRRGWPDGGKGGDGGDVIFVADTNVHTLLDFQFNQHFTATSGFHASSNNKTGHRGDDLIVRVPAGTLIKDAVNGFVLRDLEKPGDSAIIAKGGAGGRGNSRHLQSEPGSPGEERTVILELKLIADVGIVGYPNAGKSTFISRVSSARPKIANYPFTTKAPVLGVVRLYDSKSLVVAEIPGLIEGAHLGRGLGYRFLKHTERTKVLIHLVDAAATEGRSPLEDYSKLNRELKLYSKGLARKPQIVAMNKADLPDAAVNIKLFKKKFPRVKVYPVSALAGTGIKELFDAVYKKLKGTKRNAQL